MAGKWTWIILLLLMQVWCFALTYGLIKHGHHFDIPFYKACDCTEEFRDIEQDIRVSSRRAKEFAAAVDGLTLEVKDLMTVNQVWQQAIEKDWREQTASLRTDIDLAKKWAKQRRGCGEW